MLGLVGAAMSVGCARSANLRSSAGNLPDLAPAGTLEPAAVGSPARLNPPPASYPTSSTSAAAPDRGVVATAAPSTSGTDVTATSLPTGPIPDGGLVPDDSTEAANGSAPGAGSAELQPPAPGVGIPPAPPLRDSELRRAQAITRQHFESLGAVEAPTPTPTPDPVNPTPPTIAESSPTESLPGGPTSDPSAEPTPETIPPAPLPPLAASTRVPPDPGPSEMARPVSLPPLTPIDSATPSGVPTASESPTPAVESPAPAVESPKTSVSLFGPAFPDAGTPSPAPAPSPASAGETLATPEPPTAPDRAPAPSEENPAKPEAARPLPAGPEPAAATSAAPDDRPDAPAGPPASASEPSPTATALEPSLQIAELKVCSDVKKFGVVTPINPDRVELGRWVLIYCEMAGLEYQHRGKSFVSRLAAHIELQSESDGRVVWEEAPGTAEDVCPNRRQDYFVSYRLRFPRTLEPGRYRLRLVQTDMIGNRVASREVPITLVRRGSSR